MIKVDRKKNPVLRLLRPLDTLKDTCLGKDPVKKRTF